MIVALGRVAATAFGALGCVAALRTGSGEAVQGLFPLFFVFIFLSSMAACREPAEDRLVPHGRDVEPVSYLIEGFRSPVHRRLGRARRCGAASLSRSACARGLVGVAWALKARLQRT